MIKERIRAAVLARDEELIGVSHAIHSRPELAFEEHYAADLVAGSLASHGFDVRVGAAGLDTAILASRGEGPLRIAFIAEYDALPGIGHACGHNVIAASSLGAAIGLASVADELDLQVQLIGTPAEEQGGGKVHMLEAGCFDGVHAAMAIHPGGQDLHHLATLALAMYDIRFDGVSAHAAVAPHRGRNAADALTIAQVAIGLLRQHIRPSQRIHGITLEAGTAPNVIPELARARYLIRARTATELIDLCERVEDCVQGGGRAAGCRAEFTEAGPMYRELSADPDLTALYVANAAALGRTVHELSERHLRAAGSTDMGNLSARLPVIHPLIDIGSGRTAQHEPAFATAAAAPPADQAVLDAALALAWTAADAAENPTRRTALLTACGDLPNERTTPQAS